MADRPADMRRNGCRGSGQSVSRMDVHRRATYRSPARTVTVRRFTRSKTLTRPRRTIVVVLEQASTVVQSVPKEAPRLNLPCTRQRPRRRRVLKRTRRSLAAAAVLRVLAAHSGRATFSLVATLRPELWKTMTSPPDTSPDAFRRFPRIAVRRTGQPEASRVGGARRRYPLGSKKS